MLRHRSSQHSGQLKSFVPPDDTVVSRGHPLSSGVLFLFEKHEIREKKIPVLPGIL
jgi:hypothetical protein